ncbi:MAG: phosphatidylserine/phosphatidylglycerophosphate/cardiolipin synthase family protein [Proteobacteria bacterium]|nr:MAG: phosphatidylserine/phosphatidylglycerophosphate/cardiolipin synthase family protein [Pseudomonadota bacterium]
MIKISITLFAFCLISCRSTQSELKEVSLTPCAGSSVLDRVVAVVAPEKLPRDQASCLQKEFQSRLNAENANTLDKKVDDRFDSGEVQKNSSQVGSFGLTTNNIVDRTVYARGPQIFSKMRTLIAAAQEEVLIQTFVWESESDSAKEVMAGIKDLEAARRTSCPDCKPVTVRILANYGPTALEFVARVTGGDRPTDSGADARAGIEALHLDPRYVDARVLTYTHKALGLTHAKSTVIDNQIAMITGANIQRFNDKDVNWNDMGYVVGGELVKGLRKDAINNLIRADQGTERDGNVKIADAIGVSYDRIFHTTYPVRARMNDPMESAKGIPIVFTSRNGQGFPTTNNNNTQNRAFQTLFQNAQRSIDIQTPNFNDDAVVRGLGSVLNRNVKLQLLVSKLFNCKGENQIGQGGQNAKGLNRLLREAQLSAPQGDRLDIRWFSKEVDGGSRIVLDNPNGKVPEDRPDNSHAKFMVIDDAIVAVGAANMDTQSWNQSREINIIVFHEEVAKVWKEQVFAHSFQIAVPVTAAELVPSAISCP